MGRPTAALVRMTGMKSTVVAARQQLSPDRDEIGVNRGFDDL
jgi:hypothetical protein